MPEPFRIHLPERNAVFDFVPVPVKTIQPDGVGLSGLTDEMYRAFWTAFDEAYLHHGHKESTSAGYNAMIAAAPKPPAP